MTQNNINLPKSGPDAVFTLAQMQDLQSMPNRAGDTRLGANNTGMGKKAGAHFLVDMGSDLLISARARGAKSSDSYNNMSTDGALITPVNIVDPDNLSSSWTLSNCTYDSGLITSSNTSNSASQVVTLSAGTYSLSGFVGNTDSGHTTKLVVSGATDSTVLTKVNSDAPIGSTVAIDESTSKFTLLATSQDVTFTLSVVTTAAGHAGAVGSGTMRFILEADTALSYPVAGQQ